MEADNRTCICCGTETRSWVRHDPFLGNPLRLCPQCRHIQIAVVPSQEEVAHYYRSTYSASRGAQVGVAYAAIMRRRAAAQISFMRRTVAVENVTLCDVGCGYGFLLEAFRAYTKRLHGIEFDPATVEYCRDNGLQVALIEGEDDLLNIGTTDLVTLSHCLEHFSHPLETLTALVRQARHVFIEVPAYDPEVSEQFEDLEGHMNFFSRESLKLFLQKNGMEILSFSTCGPPVSFFYRPQWKIARSILRRITRDFFMRMYRRPSADGIWIRAMVRIKS